MVAFVRLLATAALLLLFEGGLMGTRADEPEEWEEAVHLDGCRDGLVARPSPGAGDAWVASPSFSLELWWRPERKAKDDHEEQCLVSHGSWRGRFKLSTLPGRTLRFTVRDSNGAVVDCDGSQVLRPRRWVHLAAGWDAATGVATLLLNGAPDPSLRCNPPQPLFASPPSKRGDRPPRPAHPAAALPLLVGTCSEGGGATERSRGSASGLRVWPAIRPAAEVQADLFAWRLPPPRKCFSSSSSTSSSSSCSSSSSSSCS
jgi:hypothetical protein